MENTIKKYQNTETPVLQSLLKRYELESENYELKNSKKFNNEIQKVIDDYEIDIHLIRMELNKRLWKSK